MEMASVSALPASAGGSKDYYQVLRLHPDAAPQVVEQAYWALARRYSAALRTDPAAEQDLEELNEAYRVLGSPALRKEYDQQRRGGTQAGTEGKSRPRRVLPSIVALAEERARWRQKEAGESRALPSLPFALPDFDAIWWRTALVILVLGAVALMAGADLGPVIALIVIGLAFAVVPLAVKQSAARPKEESPRMMRRLARPTNLGRALIPAKSPSLRRLVYQIYSECPHLAPADARATVRYALLTQRFLKGEEKLRELETGHPSDGAHLLAAEQRALAAELREHEAALGIISTARPASDANAAEHDPTAPAAHVAAEDE
jgi:hypothetical protein